MNVKAKITKVIEQLNQSLYEKEEVIAKALLASLAGESIFLLGAPGVAKSLVARQLKHAFTDATSFEYLMNRFSTPEELFGPISISKLKDEDKYERIVTGYLPDANIVFLDEIWKSGPSIQNTLLTILNEKIYRNGATEIKVPIKALIGASNELPAKNEGLEALWDRFLIRLNVEGISDKDNFNSMISGTSTLNGAQIIDPITKEEYDLWSSQIDAIELPKNIFEVIHVIRFYLAQHNQKEEHAERILYVSDRRWKKIVRLLKTAAFLNDRTSVDLIDCFLIKDCIWNEIEDKNIVAQFVDDAIEKHGYSITLNLINARTELEALTNEIAAETIKEVDTRTEELEPYRTDYYEILNFPDSDNLIEQIYFKDLTAEEEELRLSCWDTFYRQVRSGSYYTVKMGHTPFSIIVDDVEYKLKTVVKGELKTEIKKPHTAIEKEWDQRVATLLEFLNTSRASINTYKEKELKYIKSNLFVPKEKAALVEKHIVATEKEIEKLEIESTIIRNNYKSIK